jgi:20S proteasome subunit beta 5
MLSDLVNLDEILDEISFDGKLGEPLKPFEQLMGCMPPSQAHHLPEPYRWLMADPSSPIIDFYPKSFTIDMNGKRWPWEAVTLLPFIDSMRLLEASRKVDYNMLTQEERARNSAGDTVVMKHDPNHSESLPALGDREGFRAIEDNKTSVVPFALSEWSYQADETPVLKPKLDPSVTIPLPGYASLRDGPVQSLWRRKMGINVFGSRSRYKTACLELSKFMPPLPRIEALAPKLIGSSIFINYPYFTEGLVTAVSDENVTIRGRNEPRRWTPAEAEKWRAQRDGVARQYETGEGYTGSGGLTIPEDQAVTLSVRPMEGLATTKDGMKVKSYAKFEVEIPLISTFWVPSQPDPRLAGIPSRLEKDAFELAKPLHKVASSHRNNALTTAGKRGPKRGKLLPSTTASSSLLLNRSQEGSNILNSTDTLLPDYDDGANKISGEGTHAAAISSVGGPKHAARLSSTSHPSKSNSRSIHTSPFTASSEISTDEQDFLLDAKAIASKAVRANGQQPSTSASPWNSPARGFSTASYSPHSNTSTRGFSSMAHHQQASRQPVGRVPATMMRGGSTRGSFLKAGVAAAAFFLGSTCATGTISPWTGIKPTGRLSFLIKPGGNSVMIVPDSGSSIADLLRVRGGDLEETEEAHSKKVPPLEFAHGTTTISFIFQGGIVAAVDSRASLGSFVGSKTTQKVLPVNSHILGTMAGGAADCMFWIRKLKSEAMLHELKEGRRMSVARASRLLSNALYQNRGLGLSVGTMIMGFDHDGPPRIYYVDNTGVRIEGDMFAVGSGSTFALGILDTERRHGLTEDEAVDLGIKAIRHATFRDAFSGGFINVFVITKDGWKKVFTEDLARAAQSTQETQAADPWQQK